MRSSVAPHPKNGPLLQVTCCTLGSGWGAGSLAVARRPPSCPDTLPFALVLTVEKLAGCKLNVAEVTQSEIGQKQKLQTVLEAVHELLRPHGWALQWAVDCESLLGWGAVLSAVHTVHRHGLQPRI